MNIKREVHSSDDGTIFYQSRSKGYTVISGTSLTIKVSDSSVGDNKEVCDPELEDCSTSSLEDEESGNLE